jgi:DNA-binding transcriptional regulator LsrR (DeoR family)
VHAIDWQRYDALKAQGLSGRQIAEALGIAESTLRGVISDDRHRGLYQCSLWTPVQCRCLTLEQCRGSISSKSSFTAFGERWVIAQSVAK